VSCLCLVPRLRIVALWAPSHVPAVLHSQRRI
jgi:hypothetical protein